MRTKAILTAVVAGATFGTATPTLAQSAPPAYNSCSYSANGNLAQTYARSCVSTSASGTPVGNWGQISGASTAIVNGRIDPSVTYASPDPGGSNATSWSHGGWDNAATAQSNSGSISTGSANLSDGTIHAFISNPDANWGSGFFTGQISDIVTFTNTSGSAVLLDIGYAFDGKFSGIIPNGGYTSGSVGLALTSPDYTLKFAGTGNTLVGGTNGYATGASTYFDAGGGSYGAPGTIGLSTFMSEVDYTSSNNFDFQSGLVSGLFNTSIIIPVGQSQLGFALWLSLDCRQRSASCDFGNTSAFKFGALADGLSYTSNSGALFSEINAPGGVPEPATWGMMILGFGLIGGLLRRRTNLLEDRRFQSS